jgi:hypothetical protein
MLIISTTHKMPTPNYNPQHNFKVCKLKIWFSPTSIPRTSLSKIPMIPHLQKCRCQSVHTKIRQTDPDHHIQTKYHIYNKHSKYKPLHTCNNIKSEWASEGMSDCCLMQKISILFSYIMTRTSYTRWDDVYIILS